ncbi:SusD/RagB family nutrient-binding outer membrane lipoprotein [Larkinella punicea]|uniref:SusD/RagB family nutrient-binding outer membrane lipoprotein n=1 Tax=Larkinella punicea TaxID=2315727 RepID=A0A368JJC7_9BACT|nr:SusD/RagB family nutrient-binding outer membrane lipoprotein [Larkinella punicea]RCR67757.1 SusD/RagB family nutrient-binding outer membrane lipoprotein [Larkinella punicea]
MKRFHLFSKAAFILAMFLFSSCEEQLTELNENPNVVDPATANPNMLMPTVTTGLATSYLGLGYGDIAGVVQHTQKDGWFGGHNHYDWTPNDWSNYYNLLRNNEFLYQRASELGFKFHQGVALTMKAYIFGLITDLWGDAPYTNALKGNLSNDYILPTYDSQEVIYKGIIEDLKAASALFATGETTGYLTNYDVFYKGNAANWHKFANSLLLRYYMRISAKLPDVAKAGIESVYSSGIYIKSPSEDAVMDYIGATAANSWPGAVAFEADPSEYRRRKPAKPLVDKLLQFNDPRLKVWIAPVYVQWVADPTLTAPVDPFIRRNGVIQTGTVSLTDAAFLPLVKAGTKFTRNFNPNTFSVAIDTREYVGVPPGLIDPSSYNYNPTTGQVVQNQHVSQLAELYRGSSGGLLKARLMSASETSFILAEAAMKGWAVGSAETHYNAGVKNSLETWGVGTQYNTYIATTGVKFDNTLAQLMDQKWISSWTAAPEAWFDYRRTGLPAFKPGPAAAENVLPVRFIYGDNETNYNNANVTSALSKLEENAHTKIRGKNSQWAKPWVIQGTGKPW